MSSEILKALKELEASPEQKRLARAMNFDLTLYVFDRNYKDLANHLAAQDHPAIALQMWSVQNRYVLRDFLQESARLLHNLVAEAMSLVDHTRNLYKELCEAKGNFADYQPKVDAEFANSGLARFIIGLRQFCQHYQLPILSGNLNIGQGQDFRSDVSLSKVDLLRFSSWPSAAKRFLEDQPDKIDLRRVLDDYQVKIQKFYEWFRARQMQLHADDIQAVEAIKAKAREEHIKGFEQSLPLELAGLGTDFGVPDLEDQFSLVFSVEDWRELHSIAYGSPARLAKAVEILKRRGVTNPAVIGAVTTRYAEAKPMRAAGY